MKNPLLSKLTVIVFTAANQIQRQKQSWSLSTEVECSQPILAILNILSPFILMANFYSEEWQRDAETNISTSFIFFNSSGMWNVQNRATSLSHFSFFS